MQQARFLLAAGVDNGILYAVGGWYNAQVLTTVEGYDPVSNTWSTKAPMPTPRGQLGVAAVDGILYAVGGADIQEGALDVVESYDPSTDAWTTVAPLPEARSDLGVGVIKGKLYAVGGDFGRGNPVTGIVEVYTPKRNRWAQRQAMPTPCIPAATAVLKGILYTFGCGPTRNVTYAYDPSSDSWTTKAPINFARFNGTASAFNDHIDVIGGFYGFPLKANDAYRPQSDTWSKKAKLPVGTCCAASGVINNVLYFVGGDTRQGYSSATYAYTP